MSRARSCRAASHRRLRVARSAWTSLSRPAPVGPAAPASSLCCCGRVPGLSFCLELCTAVMYTCAERGVNDDKMFISTFLTSITRQQYYQSTLCAGQWRGSRCLQSSDGIQYLRPGFENSKRLHGERAFVVELTGNVFSHLNFG